MNSFEKFSQLHQGETPLLLGNIWDVHSAKMFEAAGYKAIGTSSHAVANTFGYDDGEQLEFETLFQLAKRVAQVVSIPLSIDIEGGFSRTAEGIIKNIRRLHEVGVVGVNLEDTVAGATRQFQSVSAFQKTLSEVADYLSKNNINVFLNIRTDGFLLGMSTALAETLARIKAYENSGASGIFVPCVTDKNDIGKLVKATSLPLNVMCMPQLPDFEELKSLGVKKN